MNGLITPTMTDFGDVLNDIESLVDSLTSLHDLLVEMNNDMEESLSE